jgi:hypothetical protein
MGSTSSNWSNMDLRVSVLLVTRVMEDFRAVNIARSN